MTQSPDELSQNERRNPAGVPEEGSTSGVSIAEILGALVRHKYLIAVSTAICLIAAIIYVSLAPKVYEASSTLRIDPTRAGSLGLSDLLSIANGESSGEQLSTEMSILKSDQVALATLDHLSPAEYKNLTGLEKGHRPLSDPGVELSRNEELALTNFKKALSTKQVEGTQLVTISFRNRNPELASSVVNHLIEAYIRGNFDSRYDSVAQVNKWLSRQMSDLEDKASIAQRKLSEFQEAHNLIGTDPQNNTTIDRLKLLNARMTEAEGDRIVKEAQMRAAEAGDPTLLASLLPDAKLQALQQQEATLYGQYVQLSAKFGASYPPLTDVKQQLARVKGEIASNVGTITQRLKEDYDSSQRAESMLRSRFDSETQRAYALNRSQTAYAVLLADATSSRDLYDTLQYKLQQATVDAGLNSVNTMVVDRSRVPITPVEPKKFLILGFAILLGSATGIGTAILKESLSDQVQGLMSLENATGLPGLAVVPHFENPRSGTGDKNTQSTMIGRRLVSVDSPRSRAAEAYRSLRNAILLSAPDVPPKVVLITSSLPAEGKSSTAANYAAVVAQKGGRVLLVDTDLRRPSLHTYFGVPNTSGLSTALIGSGESIKPFVPVSDLPDFHFLPAGPKVPFPSEALGSTKFRDLIRRLAQEYDAIILDSAPVLSVSDTTPVASWVDMVIIVVRAGVTPLKAVQRTRTILHRARGRLSGIVLNDVSGGIGSEYGYGYDYVYGQQGKDGAGYYE